MQTRHRRGDTDTNNGITLDPGYLSIDTEKKAVRIHDGETLGGYEAVGEQVVYGPPGPQSLTAGDSDAGFYGEVGPDDFISYEDLCNAVGFSAGSLVNNDESLWLKYSLDNKTLYVAKKAVRVNISWLALYDNGIALSDDAPDGDVPTTVDQDVTVEIDGYTFRVRLLKGIDGYSLSNDIDGDNYNEDWTEGSEWNRLLYPVHSGNHTNSDNPEDHSDPNVADFGSWADYSDEDLNLDRTNADGGVNWVQEMGGGENMDHRNRLWRGGDGIISVGETGYDWDASTLGWRPVLEWVE